MTRSITTSTIRRDFHVGSTCNRAVASHGKTLRMGGFGGKALTLLSRTLRGPGAAAPQLGNNQFSDRLG